jgi:hypothetical protein
MLNLVDKWVKNVYSLRTRPSKTSGWLHTTNQLTRQLTHSPVYNIQLTPLFIQTFTPLFYTPKINQFHLLYSQLYPQSTVPINKKKKKILERNT